MGAGAQVGAQVVQSITVFMINEGASIADPKDHAMKQFNLRASIDANVSPYIAKVAVRNNVKMPSVLRQYMNVLFIDLNGSSVFQRY